MNVLVTGAGTTTAVTVLKGLRKDPSIQVFMGDINKNCAGAYLGDFFIEMPPAQSNDFVEKVIKICKDNKINLVIPIIDYEFLHWTQVKDIVVAISSKSALEKCIEKDKTYTYFKSLNIPAITTWTPDKYNGYLPAYVKPRCGRASIDNYKIVDKEELYKVLERAPDSIIQPFTTGTEVTIDTISDFNGKMLAASPRIRIEIKSGQAYRSITIHSPELVEMARKIVEGLPIIGAANVQCFLNEENEPAFFEINARFGAGTITSIEAGMNGPLALVDMVRNKVLQPLTPKPGVLMMRYWQEVFKDNTNLTPHHIQ